MQVQKQAQQITEEDFLLPLSEDELASLAGGAPPMPKRPQSGSWSLRPDPDPNHVIRDALMYSLDVFTFTGGQVVRSARKIFG